MRRLPLPGRALSRQVQSRQSLPRRILPARTIASLAALFFFLPPLFAAAQNRVAAVLPNTLQPLPQSVSPRVNRAADLGTAPASTLLTPITLRFAMTPAQQTALTQLLADQQNPASPRYRQWLTPEQFAARFGLTPADLATVSNWLTANGFTVLATARSRTFIQFSGTVAQAQAAFHTTIHRVSFPAQPNRNLTAEEHIANLTPASLPAAIAAVVSGLSGLNDFKLRPRLRTRQVPASPGPDFTSSISGDHFIAPGDFYTIYDVSPLLANSINGAGITIAVAGQTDISLSDVAAFRSASGLSANLPTVKLYGTDPGTNSGDIDEAQLDVEWSGAVAPSASILYVNSSNVINSLTDIIDNDLAPIASISYGDCEPDTGASDVHSLNQTFMQANAQGITVLGPAGDSGATDCDDMATSATHGLAVDFPASSPYVTGLGGTMFNEGSGTYFAPTNNANAGSALSYIPEAVWNETAVSLANGGTIGAGGGGVSVFFPKPAWQTGNGVPNDSARDVPDVALNAAADHDGYLYCSQGSCVNGFRSSATPTTSCPSGNCLNVVGGTSVSTPAFAGILALVQQKTGASIGNANPVLYALANSAYNATVFHDVTVGNNDSPCTAGSTGCPNGGSIGYSATPGYDRATGWGSVDAFVLANSWALVSPSGPATNPTVADFTLTPATATATVASGADAPGIVYTVTPVNGFTGSVTLSILATGSTLNASELFSVNPVSITSTAAATTTLVISAYVVNGQAVSSSAKRRIPSSGSASVPPLPQRTPPWLTPSAAALAGLLLFALPRRRRLAPLLTALVALGTLAASLSLTGCGSGIHTTTSLNTAPGTYTLTVTATATNAAGTQLTHTSTITLVVQ